MANTFSPNAAQLALVQSEANGKLALLRRENSELKKLSDNKDLQIAQLGAGLARQTTAGRFWMGASTLTTFGAALAGGAAHGYLTAKDAQKAGPFDIMSVLGFAAAAGGVAFDEVAIGELVSAVARGLVAGPMWQAAYSWGERKATAAQAPQAAAMTTPATPAKRG
jgi:hypothetical protein